MAGLTPLPKRNKTACQPAHGLGLAPRDLLAPGPGYMGSAKDLGLVPRALLVTWGTMAGLTPWALLVTWGSAKDLGPGSKGSTSAWAWLHGLC